MGQHFPPVRRMVVAFFVIAACSSGSPKAESKVTFSSKECAQIRHDNRLVDAWDKHVAEWDNLPDEVQSRFASFEAWAKSKGYSIDPPDAAKITVEGCDD